MKPYNVDEFVMAAHRTKYALYSYLKVIEKDIALEKVPAHERPVHPDSTLFMFYEDNFTLNLSELLNYFEKQDDQRVLSKLTTSNEQRERLRFVRHSNAHLDNVAQTMRRRDELDIVKVLRPLLMDLQTIILFIRDFLAQRESLEAAKQYMAEIRQVEEPFDWMKSHGKGNAS